ncbi:hypothetical protein Godav_027683 [Gossypium davidsonii]|uniref:Uncharacterized protein n=1 Tax=Gossypium davidsonii TaxID=34287 RepID=A0A7J8RWP7_GOSDV|nr:hypothetical protein [Gossypium davidsonii]
MDTHSLEYKLRIQIGGRGGYGGMLMQIAIGESPNFAGEHVSVQISKEDLRSIHLRNVLLKRIKLVVERDSAKTNTRMQVITIGKSGRGMSCIQRRITISEGYVSIHPEGFCKLKEHAMIWRSV